MASPPRHVSTTALSSALRMTARMLITGRMLAEGKQQAGGTLLVMPAWDSNSGTEEPFLGVKLATVFPGNAIHGLPSVAASYLLSSAATGAPLALMDGTAITLRCTAAASALAAHYLARRDSKVLLMVGTRNLAPHLILAHLSATPSLRYVLVWGRTLFKAQQTAEDLISSDPRFHLIESEGNSLSDVSEGQETCGVCVQVVSDLERGVRMADIVSSKGSIFVDSKDGDAITGSGDLMKPITSGAILEKDIGGGLFELCSERVHGRNANKDICVFKSVGLALEDLVAAKLVWKDRDLSHLLTSLPRICAWHYIFVPTTMAGSNNEVNDQAVAQQVEEKKVDAVEVTEKPSEETKNSVEEKSSTDVKPSANADSEPAAEDKEKKDDETTPDSDVVEVEAEKVPEVPASADAVPSTTETTTTISTKRKAEASEDETGAKKVCLEAEA
ncbi:unnamed protein product [Closterium sp. Yama58-4]|nr:unnamed protein product [Closterium sp. Yama58-4]